VGCGIDSVLEQEAQLADDPNAPKDFSQYQTEGMGLGLAVLAVIAVVCGVIIWSSVYL
jgi:hypothetical protein